MNTLGNKHAVLLITFGYMNPLVSGAGPGDRLDVDTRFLIVFNQLPNRLIHMHWLDGQPGAYGCRTPLRHTLRFIAG